jgi:hypothetical protein
LVVPDSSGNRPEISIDPSQRSFSNTLSLAAGEVNEDRLIELCKAKEFGRNQQVLSIRNISKLLPGSRVVIRWLND